MGRISDEAGDEGGAIAQCDPTGTWDLMIVGTAEVGGDGCKADGSAGQGPSQHLIHIVMGADGEVLPSLEKPNGTGQDVSIEAEILDPEGSCTLKIIITASVFMPAFFPDDEDGNQIAQYVYELEDVDGVVTGEGTLHLEFQTVTGNIEDPCTEPIAVTGTHISFP